MSRTDYKEKKLTVCEAKVMKVLWEDGKDEGLTLPEIVKKVNQKNGVNWKDQTVSTFLARLYAKEYTTKYRSGRTFYHVPVKDRNEYVKAITEEMLVCWYANDKEKMIAAIKDL